MVIIACGVIFLGVCLRLNQLQTRTLFIDEAYTQMRVAGHTASEMIQAFYNGRSRTAQELRGYATVDATSSAGRLVTSLEKEDAQHPPLFYLAELGMVRLLGDALFSWRLLPAILGILAIPAAYMLARELFWDNHAGLLAAALFAVSPIERIYSQQAREYSLFTLLVFLSTYAVIRATRKGNLSIWALYGLLEVAGLYTSPIMAYVIAAHAAFALAMSHKSHSARMIQAFTATTVAAVVAYAPWIYQLLIHRNDIAETNTWSATSWPFFRLAAKWIFNTGSTFFDLEYLNLRWGIVFGVVMILAVVLIVRGFRAASVEARWCLGAAIIVPAALLIAPDILLGQHRSSVARYGLPVFAMLTIITARGLIGRPLAAAIILGAGLCSSGVGALHQSWWDNDANANDARVAAIINDAPSAQIATTILPPQFLNFARLLDPGVRVSLSRDTSTLQVSPQAVLFVLSPTASDLQALASKTGRHFSSIPYSRATTAHDIGTSIAGQGTSDTMADLYRAVDAQQPAR
jgi:uncharacterized membrane protein